MFCSFEFFQLFRMAKKRSEVFQKLLKKDICYIYSKNCLIFSRKDWNFGKIIIFLFKKLFPAIQKLVRVHKYL